MITLKQPNKKVKQKAITWMALSTLQGIKGVKHKWNDGSVTFEMCHGHAKKRSSALRRITR